MWEAIESNKRRSVFLIAIMGALLVALGGAIGMLADPQAGLAIGALVALGLWLILLLVALFQGESVLLLSARARQIQKADAPQLWNIVEEMTIASGLGAMPKVYIIDEESPNAFAVGRKTETAAVAVTSGLLRRLNRDELQGVIAHEIGHIKNRDVLFMTLAAVMMGTIVLIADVFLRSLWYGAGRRSSRSGKGGGGQVAILAVAILLAILAPIFAQLLYFACSRRREYLADASAARFTRYPNGLASALEKIALRAEHTRAVNRAVAPLYIVNPLQAHAGFHLFSTHPPTELRIKILRGMGGRAGFVDYENAYRAAMGGRERLLGLRTLSGESSMPARAPSVEPETKEQAIERAREITDLLDRMGNFLLIPCACGVRIKVPPELKLDAVSCPSCGRSNPAPRAREAEGATSAAAALGIPQPPMVYERRGKGWESFKCSCGKVIQLSPILAAPSVLCRGCGRRIEVHQA